MTRAEALAEARRRWGFLGYADSPDYWTMDYRVGIAQWDNEPGRLRGRGANWEAAFADADRREQEAKK